MTPLPRPRRDPAGAGEAGTIDSGQLDVQAIRRHFAFPRFGRIVTNNAASTQPPRLDTIAQFLGAPGRACIARYRNTTEAINAAMPCASCWTWR